MAHDRLGEALATRGAAAVARDLAAALVDGWLEAPLETLIPADRLAAVLLPALVRLAESPAARQRLARVARDLAAELADDDQRLRESLPREAAAALRELIRHPLAPDRKVLGRFLAQDGVRRFVKVLLAEALDEVAEGTLARGLVGLGRRAAAFAGDALERRRDAMLDLVLGRATELLAHPSPPQHRLMLTTAVADALLSLRGRELARELEHANPEAAVDVAARHLGAWAASPAAPGHLAWALGIVLGQDAPRPARAVLADLGLLDAARDLVIEWLGVWIEPALAQGAVSRWLASL